MTKSISEDELLSCLADKKSFEIFERIHNGLPITVTTLKLTRRQFYSRSANIIKVGLVYKSSGRFRVTFFGKVVYGLIQSLRIDVNNESKFRAIDILQMRSEISKEELNAISEILLNSESKELISNEEGLKGQRTVSEIIPKRTSC